MSATKRRPPNGSASRVLAVGLLDEWFSRRPRYEVVDLGYETSCWRWLMAIYQDTGYGQISAKIDGRVRTSVAHRVIYERAHGAIPAGFELDHLCRNRACVNPEHLEVVTHSVNVRRRPGGWRQVRPSLRKLTREQVLEIRRGGRPLRAFADEFGIGYRAVWEIAHGRSYREVM